MALQRRPRRVARTAAGLALVAVLAVSTGCGTESSGAGSGPAALPDDVHSRVLGQGVDAGLVYTIDVPGFGLAEQSAGVLGDSDYGAVYVSVDPPPTSEVHLEVRSGSYDGARCEREPLRGATGGFSSPVEVCEPDATGWYRTGGDWHEYVVLDAGHRLTVGAPLREVDRELLVTAALGARHQDGTSISPAAPSSPAPRGDLPSIGDGAPLDPHDASTAGG